MDDRNMRVEEARRLAAEQQYADALEELKSLYRENPKDPEVLYLCGGCFYKMGEPEKARKFLEMVLQIDPGNSKASNLLARLKASEQSSESFFPKEPRSPVAAQSPSGEKKTTQSLKKTRKINPKWIWISGSVIALLVVVLFGVDMYLNPKAYPFLANRVASSEESASQPTVPAPESPSSNTPNPAPPETPAESGSEGSTFGTTLGSLFTGVGLVTSVVSGIWLLILAVQESTLWFIACIVCSPATLVFVITHWSEAKNPFFFQVIGGVFLVIGGVLNPAFDPLDLNEDTSWEEEWDEDWEESWDENSDSAGAEGKEFGIPNLSWIGERWPKIKVFLLSPKARSMQSLWNAIGKADLADTKSEAKGWFRPPRVDLFLSSSWRLSCLTL
ncbi:MAG: tetratricopeptide repeat protein [Candidatus Omnitrophica bacterium]|nr:tetratricopeptide repeat protein [Candidatus Omnitrophota bacterium]MCB9769620.1 tetratricopeptide repeat protein [Candidatus Omnitrophota bacterium]